MLFDVQGEGICMYRILIVTDKEKARRITEQYKPHIIFSDVGKSEEDLMKNLENLKLGFSECAADTNIEGNNSFIVKNAVKYIEEHYSENLTLQEAAEHIYVSRWHLSKLLNKHVGHGFSEIVNLVRIHHAKELLEERSLRVIDVAEMVGFVNVSHFSRVFKKIVGVSPNEYRNQIN